ncbi:gliding motility-associated C-terminal domain-containing protein [Saccharicrinis carchari]|uniref:Gliding motility-associated C-terminal domain-containing protein n=1 Tax=Saccharicrinis carchari TaxID=1168039 RepID=A0A521BR52_SACCC|nr:PKD domain-containing protein [Saccharicrinis carchari]SMO49545.1 gliding motility-associated C-terminal domain-containing protein [Saccharicrinis carchari]
MINQHNTTIRLAIFTFLFSLIGNISLAQDCSYVSNANDIQPDGLCAPVNVDWEVIYRGVNNNGASVQIQYDWDDGNPVEIVDAVLTNAVTREWTATHKHEYPNTGSKCNYQPRVNLVVNGVVCTSSTQFQIVTVWDTDDKNGGWLEIDPAVYPICVGNDALFNFTDNSQWNCTPTYENDVINDLNRWVQWIYGTGGTDIFDAEVDGLVRVYPFAGNINHVPGPVESPVAPHNTSLDIYIPNHHPVGAFFEVTLRNWNVCNPYDDPSIPGPPANAADGDYPPETVTAMAIIVALPDATIDPVANVCESEPPFLLIAVDGGGTWSGPGISDPASSMFDPALAGPGTHTITYSITDGNGCSDSKSVVIIVKESPKADITPSGLTNFCPGVVMDLDGNPSDGEAPYTHSWTGQTGPLNNTSIQAPEFQASTVGKYNLIYQVTDKNGCWGKDTIELDVAEVNISFAHKNIETCLGTAVTLNPNPSGGSESFVFHQWTGARTDKLSATDIQTPDFTADETGVFTFDYTVRDSYGCEGTETITITVYAQPVADAGTDITECGLKTILAANASIGNGTWKVISGPGSLALESFTIPAPNVVADTYGTYFLRWTENNLGCIDSMDVNLTFVEMPTPSVMPNKDTCGLSLQLIANKHIGSGKWVKTEGPGNALFSDSSKEKTQVSVNTSGKYKFAWVEDNGHCIAGDTLEVNFFTVPTAQITPPPALACTPMQIDFQNTSVDADSYYWDFGNGVISNLENPQQIFTNKTPHAVDYEISMIATTTNGCADTLKHSVKVAPRPISYFDADKKTGCSPLITKFTNKSQGGDSYAWTFGDSSPQEAGTDALHTFTNIETYTQSYQVQLVTTNTYSCTDTSRLFVSVYPNQQFNLTASPDSGCSPLNTTFTADPGAFKYEWDFGDGHKIPGAGINAKLFENNTKLKQKHKVTLYTTTFYGCLDTTETNITVLPSPTAKFQPDNTNVCAPKEVLFTNSSTDAVQSYWEFGDGSTISTPGNQNVNHNYINNTFTPRNFRVRLVTENSFGCKDSIDGFTIVNPAVNASISGATTDCAPFEAHFGNNTTGANTYLWDYGDGNTSAGMLGKNIFENNTDVEQDYEIKMIASSVYGCSDTASVTVKALPSPNTYFEPNDFTVCSPKQVKFTNFTQNIINSVWRFGDGTSTSTPGNENVEHTYINDDFVPKDFKIQLITENSFGCKDSMDGFTSVKPKVVAKITGSDKGCSPLEMSFGNESAGANSFVWDYGDGNSSTGYLGLNIFTNDTDTDKEYNIAMVAQSAYGCSDTAHTTVTVYATPAPQFSVTPQQQQMPRSTVQIDNQTTGSNWQYFWDFGDSNTAQDKQPKQHTYADYGSYSIELKAFSEHCENSLKKQILIIANLPEVEYGPSAEGCPALTVDFYSTAKNAENYLWDFGDGNSSSDPNPTHTYYTKGKYTVKLTVTGPGGQTIKDDLIINVYPEPTALFEVFPNVVTIPGETVTFGNKSMGANSFSWDFGDGQRSIEMHPKHNYTKAGDYSITLDAKNEFGCTNTYVQRNAVTAQEGGDISFPNAFTPNTTGPGDGRYDRTDTNNYIFHPVVQEGIEEYQLKIFSRWGQLLFESDNIKIGWNGYYKNQLCTQGVYIWKATCRFSTGQVKVLTGDVTLIR